MIEILKCWFHGQKNLATSFVCFAFARDGRSVVIEGVRTVTIRPIHSCDFSHTTQVVMPSAVHGKKKESYKHKNHVDEELAAGLAALLPFLIRLKILPETANVTDIDVDALKNLAGKWYVPSCHISSNDHFSFPMEHHFTF